MDWSPPPKLWTPPKPAIVRAASLKEIERLAPSHRGSFLPGMMGVSGFAGAAAGVAGLANSLDFESGSTQYLSFTGRSGTNNKGTLSVWAKRESTGVDQTIFCAKNSGGADPDWLWFNGDVLRLEITGLIASAGGFRTTTTYSSTSTWYHILLAFDAAQSGSDKVRIKVNNATPSFEYDGRSTFSTFGFFNTTQTHWFGRRAFSADYLMDGLLADIRWYDNQYLDASDFGQDESGTWTRKKTPTSAAFGTNGIHLDGSGSVGTDVSGNSTSVTNTNTVTHSATIPPEI